MTMVHLDLYLKLTGCLSKTSVHFSLIWTYAACLPPSLMDNNRVSGGHPCLRADGFQESLLEDA